MRLAPIVSILVMSLALNAQTIQGKGVRVPDVDMFVGYEEENLKIINLLGDEVMKVFRVPGKK